MSSTYKVWVLAATLASLGHAHAAVTAEDAAQLGKTLTPWGAEQAASADGRIPAYSGPVKPPASYDPQNPGVRPDPFADERPLYSISAENLSQYADKVNEGTQELMRRHPGYRIDVYPTRRTANYPQWVNDHSIKNATTCHTVDAGLAVRDCFSGIPFPIPKDGYEVMWNKLLRFEAPSLIYPSQSWFVTASGNTIMQAETIQHMEFPYYDKNNTSFGPTDLYWLFRIDYKGPARKSGEALMLHDSIDAMNTGRRAWQYIPGQRRVKLAPDIGYDTPSPESAGAANMDDGILFNGPMDRFQWTSLGKKELYLPYNTFKLNDPEQCPTAKALMPGFLNPDCVRWELRRVWVVEATLQPGKRHNYHKRVFYLDEDVFAGVADNYDASGKLYRVSQQFYIPRYESEGHDTTMTAVFDMATGAYSTLSYKTDVGGSRDTPKRDRRFWSPESLSGSGVR